MKSLLEMLEGATDTYNGKSDTCACGCAGSYAAPDSVAGQKRIAKIMNADPAKVIVTPFSDGEGCVEIENGSRVTRIYVKAVA